MSAKEIYLVYIGPWMPYMLAIVVLGIIANFFFGEGYKTLKQIAWDTSRNHATNRWSQKRLMMWGAYTLAYAACLNDFVHLEIRPNFVFHFDKVPFETKLLLFGLALTGSVFTIAGQFFARKQADGNGIPLTPLVANKEEKPEECPAAKKAKAQATSADFVLTAKE